MKKWKKLKGNLKTQKSKEVIKKIVNIFQWLVAWIIILFMFGWFLLGPFFAIVIMRNNVEAGITRPDFDVQEQINAEMMIQ